MAALPMIGNLPSTFDPKFHDEEAKNMRYLPLGKTDMNVSNLGLGAASFGNVYGDMTQHIVTKMTVKALKSGVNYIDTAPWYGLGVSEERLGVALENVPRNTYFMATKVGRYEWATDKMFDFSVAKTEASFKKSLQLLKLDYVDLIQVHDVELTSSLHQIVKHTLPTLKKFKDQGLARYIGITGYNLGVLKKIIRMCEPGTIDTILIYGRCNLLNQDLLDDLDFFKYRGIGVINASPLIMGLLNNGVDPPDWHIAPLLCRKTCKKAAALCRESNQNLAKIGMQYSMMQDPYIATTLSSSITEDQLKENLESARTNPNAEFLKRLQNIFDECPQTQWENLEVERYWKQMEENGWKQNQDG